VPAIGVLMGTAYLFTEEVVAEGAIGEEFQAQALACERTALLESGPGHVTRCAESPFVELFAETRARLMAEGADPQTRWTELEGLNLGRLRVASKGLRRAGDELVAVGRDEQRAEGMFMLGDVATLRRERTTIAQLHSAGPVGVAAAAAVPTGIDVEAIADRGPTFGRLALTPAELDLGAHEDPAVWVTRLWTVKEAVAKATGTGLRGRPRGPSR
jgi:hypothetical protein